MTPMQNGTSEVFNRITLTCRTKLDTMADKHIFVGYSDTWQAYRLLDLNLREIKNKYQCTLMNLLTATE